MKQPFTKLAKLLIFLCIISFIFAFTTSFMIQNNIKPNSAPSLVKTESKSASLVKEYSVARSDPFPESLGVNTQTPIRVYFNKDLGGYKVRMGLVSSSENNLETEISGAIVTAVVKEALKSKTLYKVNVYLEDKLFYQWQFTTR